jgi:hypothetical protein
MTVHTGDEPADSRPFCTKCGETIEIRSVREDGWIDLEPHTCAPGLGCKFLPDNMDPAICAKCGADRRFHRPSQRRGSAHD